MVVLAEEVGFGELWKGECNSTDALVLISGVASRTKKIKLGTAIYHIYGRSPVTLGIQSATLQDLSGGRLLLGLGVANTLAALQAGSSVAHTTVTGLGERAGNVSLAEVAVALSMSVTHKNPGFDARMPMVDFDVPAAAATGTLPG